MKTTKISTRILSLMMVLSMITAMLSTSASAAGSTKTYTINTGNTIAYSNTGLSSRLGSIYDSDEITVLEVTSSYCKVSYPITGSGKTKTGYISTSAILTATNGSSYTAKGKFTTYRRPGGTSYGYVASGDSVKVLGTSGSYTQIKYPVSSSSYKYAFAKTSDVQSYLTGSASTNSSSSTISTGTYQIVSAMNNNKAIDIYGDGSSNGTNINLWDKNGTQAQAINITSAGNGYYVLRKASNTNMVIEVTGLTAKNCVNVELWQYNGGANQLWSFVPAGNGYYYIKSKMGNWYLDAEGASTSNGTNLIIYSLNGGNNQKWKLISSSTTTSTTLPTAIFLKQQGSTTCTLASAAMMLRAKAYRQGKSYSGITESSIKSTAWINGSGLRWSFTYSGMSVSHTSVNGISASSLKSLLNSHPEGIVLYCGNYPHAVFLTRYSGDTFYAADPYSSYSGKELALSSTLLGKIYGSQSSILSNTTAYWYIK